MNSTNKWLLTDEEKDKFIARSHHEIKISLKCILAQTRINTSNLLAKLLMS